ncbi:MAG: HEAT repeat domain-containing protein, partial [Desulfobacterales bacterium]|nr:HEAT repeat domain-containing protein [Desulfobacterales bacterium]
LEQGEFVFASKFLKNIKELNTFVKDQKPWASKQIRNFYTEICGSTYFDILAPHWKILDIDKSNQTTAFFQYLRSLPPDVIPDLMPILLKTRSPRILRRLIKIVQALANRNIIPLKKLLYHPDKALVKRVINILGLLKNKESKELLHELIYHPLESIRKEALKSLVADDPEMLQKMFGIIDDSSLAVRQLILDYLGKHRRETNENLLLDYLANRKYKFKDREHILACYKTLGRCGSGRSIPFLQSTLFSKPWISLLRFRPSLHRKGAARALFELDIEEASEILASGSKSLFPDIRRACRYAYKGKR